MSHNSPTPQPRQTDEVRTSAPYEPPRLSRLGSVAEVTRGIGTHNTDGLSGAAAQY